MDGGDDLQDAEEQSPLLRICEVAEQVRDMLGLLGVVDYISKQKLDHTFCARSAVLIGPEWYG